MDLPLLLSTFGLIFVAELGDKTQLAAMALAARFPWPRVFLGAAAAFLLLNLLAVAVGRVLFEVVPAAWIGVAAAVLFLCFGIATLLGKDEEEAQPRAGRGPALTAFSMIFLAELGDKTQLATATLAARHASPLSVFLGSTLALWAVSLLGVLLGAQIVRVVPRRVVQRIAGVLFVVFGLVLGYRALASM